MFHVEPSPWLGGFYGKNPKKKKDTSDFIVRLSE